MTNYLKLYWRMVRYRTSLTFGLFVVLGAAVGCNLARVNILNLILAIVSLMTIYACSTSVNDLADWKIDQINLKGHNDRPLITGEGNSNNLKILAVATAIISLSLAFFVSWQVGCLILLVVVINLSYSLPPIKISHRTLLVPFFLAAAYTITPYFIGFFAVGRHFIGQDMFFLPAIYFLFLARINLKDFRDREGDAKNNKPTMVLVYGKKVVCALSIFSVIAGAVFLFVTFYNKTWFVLGLALYIFTILFSLARLLKNSDADKELISIGVASRESTGMFLTILGILILQANRAQEPLQIVLYLSLIAPYAILFFDFVKKPEQFSLSFKNGLFKI